MILTDVYSNLIFTVLYAGMVTSVLPENAMQAFSKYWMKILIFALTCMLIKKSWICSTAQELPNQTPKNPTVYCSAKFSTGQSNISTMMEEPIDDHDQCLGTDTSHDQCLGTDTSQEELSVTPPTTPALMKKTTEDVETPNIPTTTAIIDTKKINTHADDDIVSSTYAVCSHQTTPEKTEEVINATKETSDIPKTPKKAITHFDVALHSPAFNTQFLLRTLKKCNITELVRLTMQEQSVRKKKKVQSILNAKIKRIINYKMRKSTAISNLKSLNYSDVEAIRIHLREKRRFSWLQSWSISRIKELLSDEQDPGVLESYIQVAESLSSGEYRVHNADHMHLYSL